MNFSESRIAEMLDAHAPADGTPEQCPHALIVIMASCLCGLRLTLADSLGRELLTERFEQVRRVTDQITEMGMFAVCKNADDVKLFEQTFRALERDYKDILHAHKS